MEDNNKTEMSIAEYVAMAVAHELTDNMSKFSPSGSTKDEVIAVMKSSGYEEVAFPIYTQFGTNMSDGKKRKTRDQTSRRRRA